ncbi:MAG: PilZ domain-containing protein [Pseudomonadota bacterium]
MEKRKHLRVAMKNLWVDLSDGVEKFRGIVSDISRLGMRISGLPKSVNTETTKLKIVVAGKEGYISMLVGSRWQMDGEGKKAIGVEITNAPLRWTEFVMGFEDTLKTV